MNQPHDGTDNRPATGSMADVAAGMAARSGLERNADGHINLVKAAGGVRGIVESVLPGLVFLAIFTINHSLTFALVASVVVAAVFVAVRVVTRSTTTQAFAGLAGVVLSAVLSKVTGKAENYYLLGFFTNAAYLVPLVVSILMRWPLLGLLFGYARNEGVRWRQQPERRRAYSVATWILTAVMALRLVVEVPLYLAGQVDALGAMRLILGVPLYALGLWVAWSISKPMTDGQPLPAKEQERQG